MTREEQIKTAAETFADREHGAMRNVSVFNLLQYAFKCGAEWAEEEPIYVNSTYPKSSKIPPKKIYLNYVDDDDEKMTWSEEPVAVGDCDLHSREYTGLSQVWHPASEPPQPYIEIIVEQYNRGGYSNNYWIEYLIPDEIDGFRKHSDYRWAYVNDLLPSATCSEIPDD